MELQRMTHVTDTAAATQATRRQPPAATLALKLVPGILDAARWGHAAKLAGLAEDVATILDGSHPTLAKAIRRSQPLTAKPLVAAPTDLLDVHGAELRLDDVVLPAGVRKTCDRILAEQANRDHLAAWSVPPCHKMLISGPPGNGKTMLAAAMAHALDVPLLVVRYGGLMEGFLGATGKNLDKVFSYATTGPCVLFLDEFDGIGMDRGKAGDVGELRRVTNQLLLTIDRLPSHVLLVCATNALHLVDEALRRRFDTPIEIPAPTFELRLACANKELAPERCNGIDMRGHARAIATDVTENLDAVAKACLAVRREHALRSIAGTLSDTDGCSANGELPFGPPLNALTP